MRIRSIKPEFWRSDDITSLPIEDRLLFIGLWSYVDDNGVGRDKLADICADLFAHDLSVSPHDTLMRVDGGLKRLCAGGLVTRYSVEDRPFLYIRKWKEHQRINRPSPGRYPLPTSDDAVISESSVSDHVVVSEPSLPGAGEQGSRGTEEQGKESAPRKRGARLPDDWTPNDELNEQMRSERPDIDLSSELLVFRDYWIAQPGQKGVKADWDATWRNWVRRARPSPRNGLRPIEGGMSRADQKVQGWLDMGARLTSQNEPKGIA